MMIIPAIDLRDGKCVRLYKGDFARVTTYSDDPASLARKYADSGFDCLHVVDLDGAQHGSQKNQDCVQFITRSSTMTVQLGGGIRDTATLDYWFAAGITRCVIGSVAVTNRELVKDWIRDFTSDRIVLALDVRIDQGGIPRLSTHGWTQTSLVGLWDALDAYIDCGLKHVLCTDISRDGALNGPNLDLYREFSQRYPQIELQASGGVRDIDDLKNIASTGTGAAISGRALLDGRISQQEIDSFQQNA
jgi:phosphoribosylformimino-5-aminoimidazole carboxamide ribotide isomerase